MAHKSSIGLTMGALGYAGRYSVQTTVMSHISYNTSVFYSRRLINQLHGRLEFMLGKLKGDNTSLSSSTPGIKGSFNTNIIEISLKAEYDILDLNIATATPYINIGAAYYSLSNYKSSFGNKAGNKSGIALPMGAGLKYKANERLRLFIDGNVRFPGNNIDNLTAVATTKNNPNKYYSVNLGLSYFLQ